MGLGAYSIVRYSNGLNDQRVNLGVVVWHPIDGFAHRFSASINRVRAIDPRVRVSPIREQMRVIEQEISQEFAGRATLDSLAKLFRHGLEVTEPYPARIHSRGESLDHLFQLLVSPVEEIRRASSQRQFQNALKRTLDMAVRKNDPKGSCRDRGFRRYRGVNVEIGLLATAKQKKTLWRALSLQSVNRPEDQIAKAKATAMDCQIVRLISEFNRIPNIVVLQKPKPSAAEHFDESIAWLKREAEEVIPIEGKESLDPVLCSRF